MEQVDSSERFLKTAVRVMLYVAMLCILGLFVILLQTPLGEIWRRLFDAVWGLSSGQETWFITRSSGLIAFVLLWLSTVWGLGVSSKFFDRVVPRAFTYDAHEYISLLAIGMTFVHVVILLWDTYTPFTIAQLLLPFISEYRPFWIGVGIIGTYLTLLVTVTFYLRKWIGIGAFRAIHWLSFLAFFGVLVHSWFAGTDTNFAITRWMYLGTTLVVVLLAFLWLATRKTSPRFKDEVRGPALASTDFVQAPTASVVSQESLVLPPLSPKTEGVRWRGPGPIARNESNDNSF